SRIPLPDPPPRRLALPLPLPASPQIRRSRSSTASSLIARPCSSSSSPPSSSSSTPASDPFSSPPSWLAWPWSPCTALLGLRRIYSSTSRSHREGLPVYYPYSPVAVPRSSLRPPSLLGLEIIDTQGNN
ncbi:pra1 family protein b4, partial [Phtheirospermum japonicum]